MCDSYTYMETIKLNVGGQIFETTEQTLMLSDYFKAFLTRWDRSDIIFIDRSYKIFEHVLSLLRDPTYPYPSKYIQELEYYQIKHNIQNEVDDLSTQIAELRYGVNLAMGKLRNSPNTACRFLYCYAPATRQGYCSLHVHYGCTTDYYKEALHGPYRLWYNAEVKRMLNLLINSRIILPDSEKESDHGDIIRFTL